MVFSSLSFLAIFLPAVLTAYFLSPKSLKNLTLLLFSLVFYAWGEPVYILLMLLSIGVNYGGARLMAPMEGARRRTLLVLLLIFNLGLLGFFKYRLFAVDTLNALFGTSFELKAYALPIGISFYTFQILSYVIDLYRRKIPVETSLLNLATYIALFPQLIAGPIVRFETVREELASRRTMTSDLLAGGRRFFVGLMKKVLLANTAGELWDRVQELENLHPLAAWGGLIAFGLQIYFDFSGYSDMAIGLGRIFGFHFLENFDYPYLATSITEFWRRWHISLSSWFREYVYIPLGGNRRGEKRQVFNLFVVWFLTGLWHGAAWNFVLWGLYFFVLLVFEKFVLIPRFQKTPTAVKRLYTLFLVLIGWLIFVAADLADVPRFLSALFVAEETSLASALYLFDAYKLYVIPWVIGVTPWGKNLYHGLRAKYADKPIFAVTESLLTLAGYLLVLGYLADQSFNPFLYFRF